MRRKLASNQGIRRCFNDRDRVPFGLPAYRDRRGRGRSFATLKVAEDEHSSICNGLSTEEFLPGLLPKP